MSKKVSIMKTLDEYGSLTLADLTEKVTTGQTKQQISVFLANLKNEGLVERNPKNGLYSLSGEGETYIDVPFTPAQDEDESNETQTAEDNAAAIDEQLDETAETQNDSSNSQDDSPEPSTDTAVVPEPDKAQLVDEKPKAGNTHVPGVQVAENMSFNLGNALLCLWPSAVEENQITRLHKAVEHIQREIQRIETAA